MDVGAHWELSRPAHGFQFRHTAETLEQGVRCVGRSFVLSLNMFTFDIWLPNLSQEARQWTTYLPCKSSIRPVDLLAIVVALRALDPTITASPYGLPSALNSILLGPNMGRIQGGGSTIHRTSLQPYIHVGPSFLSSWTMTSAVWASPTHVVVIKKPMQHVCVQFRRL